LTVEDQLWILKVLISQGGAKAPGNFPALQTAYTQLLWMNSGHSSRLSVLVSGLFVSYSWKQF
jgi:hypothetical protein